MHMSIRVVHVAIKQAIRQILMEDMWWSTLYHDTKEVMLDCRMHHRTKTVVHTHMVT